MCISYVFEKSIPLNGWGMIGRWVVCYKILVLLYPQYYPSPYTH